MSAPTCDQLFNEELGQPIYRDVDDSWRHGCYITEVYLRTSDQSYWRAKYRISDRGAHELREGIAAIEQVEPYETTVTAYRVTR